LRRQIQHGTRWISLLESSLGALEYAAMLESTIRDLVLSKTDIYPAA
jgi:hypothetical protein